VAREVEVIDREAGALYFFITPCKPPGRFRGQGGRSMSRKLTTKDVLEYHSLGRKGKIEVVASKPCATQKDLSMAYTP